MHHGRLRLLRRHRMTVDIKLFEICYFPSLSPLTSSPRNKQYRKLLLLLSCVASLP